MASKLIKFNNFEFLPVPAGKFIMGSKEENQMAFSDEFPQHQLEIPYTYWASKYPVTVRDFALFIDDTGYVTSAEKEGSSLFAGYVVRGEPEDEEMSVISPSAPKAVISPKTNTRKTRSPRLFIPGRFVLLSSRFTFLLLLRVLNVTA